MTFYHTMRETSLMWSLLHLEKNLRHVRLSPKSQGFLHDTTKYDIFQFFSYQSFQFFLGLRGGSHRSKFDYAISNRVMKYRRYK